MDERQETGAFTEDERTSQRQEVAAPVGLPTQQPIVVDPETGQELGPLGTVVERYYERYESGPLPSPEVLSEYDQVLPGLARRIVERWEREGEHRQRLESDIVRARIRLQGRGQIIAAAISIIAIVGGLVLILLGKTSKVSRRSSRLLRSSRVPSRTAKLKRVGGLRAATASEQSGAAHDPRVAAHPDVAA